MDITIDANHTTEFVEKPNEEKFSTKSFLSRLTDPDAGKPAKKAAPEPVTEEVEDDQAEQDSDSQSVDSDSQNELESEDEDTSSAQPVDEDSSEEDPELATANNSASGTESTTEQLIGGKFKNQDDLLQSYNHAEALSTQRAQQLQESQWQVEQLTAALIQAREAQAPQEPKLFDELEPAEQDRIRRLADRQGLEPQQLLAMQWNAEQAIAKQQVGGLKARMEQIQQSQLAAQNEVNAYFVKSFGQDTPEAKHVSAKYCEFPEMNAVIRNLSPQAIERFGKRYMDLLGSEMKLQRLEAEMAAKLDAVRKSARDESRDSRHRKLKAKSEAGRAVPPQPKLVHKDPAPRSQTGSLIAGLRNLNRPASRE